MGLFDNYKKKKEEKEAAYWYEKDKQNERQHHTYFNGKVNPKYHPHFKENVIEYYASLKYPEDKYAYLNDSQTTYKDRQYLREAGFDFDEVPREPSPPGFSQPYYYPDDMPIPYEYIQRWIIDFDKKDYRHLLFKKRYLIPEEVIEANEKHKKYPPINPGENFRSPAPGISDDQLREAILNDTVVSEMCIYHYKSNTMPGQVVAYSPEYYHDPCVIDPFEGDLGDEHDVK